MLVIRKYEVGDIKAMYTLDVACFAPAFRFFRLAMKQFAEVKKARVVIAEDDGLIVVFCIVHVERDGLGYVVTLDVAPVMRRRGVVLRVLSRAEAILREERCSLMGLHVFV